MKRKFFGAAGTTPGSKNLLEVNSKRFLQDCDLYQGRGHDTHEINCCFPDFHPKKIDTVLLSHAPIDHAVNLPVLTSEGFEGNIYATCSAMELPPARKLFVNLFGRFTIRMFRSLFSEKKSLFRLMFRFLFFLCAPVLAGELTFSDFEVQEKETQWWKSESGVIVAGSPTEKVTHNTFATSKKRYANFELNLQVKLTAHQSKNPNAGIQIRSERVPDHHEMIGYQVDMARNYWGKIYDESRRRKFVAELISPAAAKAAKPGWNNYRILCKGPRIQVWLNGIKTVDFAEEDPNIPLEGVIGLQAHSGAPFEASYRKIMIREFPATEGIMTWKKLGPGGAKLKPRK